MANKYWERETPQTAQSEHNIIKYFKEAGRLQVAGLFVDRETNEPRQGKTATLSAEDCALNPVLLDLLQEFIDSAREQVIS